MNHKFNKTIKVIKYGVYFLDLIQANPSNKYKIQSSTTTAKTQEGGLDLTTAPDLFDGPQILDTL